MLSCDTSILVQATDKDKILAWSWNEKKAPEPQVMDTIS